MVDKNTLKWGLTCEQCPFWPQASQENLRATISLWIHGTSPTVSKCPPSQLPSALPPVSCTSWTPKNAVPPQRWAAAAYSGKRGCGTAPRRPSQAGLRNGCLHQDRAGGSTASRADDRCVRQVFLCMPSGVMFHRYCCTRLSLRPPYPHMLWPISRLS
jgi:hypothetical protein